MGKNKLKKFAEMKGFSCVLQYPFAALEAAGGFPLRGRWRTDFFHNDNPIVLELGCGKGEYTVGLAQEAADKNYIGIDIKGARLWRGAKTATELEMSNVAFVRTGIELLDKFFEPGEVDEIWITFPDPQMQKTRKRLVSARFLELYRKVLRHNGMIHLRPIRRSFTPLPADLLSTITFPWNSTATTSMPPAATMPPHAYRHSTKSNGLREARTSASSASVSPWMAS